MENVIEEEVITEPKVQLSKAEVMKLFTDEVPKEFSFVHKRGGFVCQVYKSEDTGKVSVWLMEENEYRLQDKFSHYIAYTLQKRKIHKAGITFWTYMFCKEFTYTVFFYAVKNIKILSPKNLFANESQP